MTGNPSGFLTSIAAQSFASLTGKPTTISGYGITDFNSLGDARWSLLGHTHTFASLTSIPTTLSGYGITDVYTKTLSDARYLQSFTETDPVFTASAAFGITGGNITSWNAKQNAITTGTTAQYFKGDLSLGTFPTTVSTFTNDSGYLTSFSETDPIFVASIAHGIIAGDITNWNAKQAALSGTGFVKISGTTISYDNSTYLTTASAAATYQVIGSYVTSVAGTTNRITSSGGTTPVIDISASYVGQSSITTLGTIATGTWQGTAIGDTYISSASTWNAKQSALTFSTGLTNTAGTVTANLVTGISGGQTVIGSTSTTSGLTLKTTTGVGTTAADMIFQVGNNGATEAMRILNSGYVGIGIVAPTYKVDVRGTVAADGVRSAMGFDIYQVVDPTTLTGAVSAGGSVDTGAHWYSVTYTTALGETHPFYTAAQVTTTGGNNTVTITIPISTDPRVTGRKIYRTKVAAAQYLDYLLTTIADNTTTTYVDTTADASLAGSAGVAFYRANTTSKNVTINGVKSMTLDVMGTYVGYSAGSSITAGGRNVFVGQNAGATATSVQDVVAMGHGAGNGALTSAGNFQVFIGSYSGRVTTGDSNTGVGYSTLYSNTSGADNAAFGWQSINLNVTGNNNTGFGSESLMRTTASNNTAIGFSAGSSITTGNQNTFAGCLAGQNASQAVAVNNSIAIGYFTYTTASNQVVIGNTSITSGGIGVVSPTAIWHLKAGTATASQAPLKFTSGTNLTVTEAGAMEYDGSHLYFSPTAAGTRYQLDQAILANGSTPLTANWNMGAFTATSTQTAATAATVYDGFILNNTTASTLGNQMYSGALRFASQGFATTPATSQTGEFRQYMKAVQGAANPTGLMVWDFQVASGGYGGAVMSLSSNGTLSVGGITSSGSLTTAGSITATGKIGAGITPTALLHVKAGTATANTAPIKLTAGTNLTVTEAGAIEYDGTHLYFTAAAAGTRYQLDQQSGSAAWGGITGTLSAQTDLQAALDAKVSPVYSRVTGSNFTIAATGTSTTLVNVTGLSFAAAINSVYEFEAVLTVSTTSGGLKYGVNYSAAGAAVEGYVWGNSSATTIITNRLTALNTGYGVYATSTTTGNVTLKGVFTTGANTGNFTVINATNTTFIDATVYLNSYLKVTKIA